MIPNDLTKWAILLNKNVSKMSVEEKLSRKMVTLRDNVSVVAQYHSTVSLLIIRDLIRSENWHAQLARRRDQAHRAVLER